MKCPTHKNGKSLGMVMKLGVPHKLQEYLRREERKPGECEGGSMRETE